jgi:hypothetical protein
MKDGTWIILVLYLVLALVVGVLFLSLPRTLLLIIASILTFFIIRSTR